MGYLYIELEYALCLKMIFYLYNCFWTLIKIVFKRINNSVQKFDHEERWYFGHDDCHKVYITSINGYQKVMRCRNYRRNLSISKISNSLNINWNLIHIITQLCYKCSEKWFHSPLKDLWLCFVHQKNNHILILI